MSLRHLDTSPKVDDFTPLAEHQEETPSTFFGAKPVLHARYGNLTLSIPTEKLQADPALAKFSATPAENADHSLVQNVEIWVSSR
jgi:chloride channel, nucleotide-sensitive, 1A